MRATSRFFFCFCFFFLFLPCFPTLPNSLAHVDKNNLLQYLDAITRAWGDWALFQQLLAVLRQIGDRHAGVTIANVAVRWVLDHPFVGAVLVGALTSTPLLSSLLFSALSEPPSPFSFPFYVPFLLLFIFNYPEEALSVPSWAWLTFFVC